MRSQLRNRRQWPLDLLPPSPDPSKVIVDFHTHIFPPDVRDRRDEYLRDDPTFRDMFADPKSQVVTAEDLLASMKEAGVDVSVALGFAWSDHEACVRHNDYLLETAARSNDRIVPFCTANPADRRFGAEVERCAAAGARGVGELRPDNQGWDLAGAPGQMLALLAANHQLGLLFHVTEEGGHEYPGKNGCTLSSFREFAAENADLPIIGAHLAGDVYRHDAPPPVFADTAAQPYLYPNDAAEPALAAVPSERLLFGSDYPLISQKRQLAEIERAVPDRSARDRILGGNASELLALVSVKS